MADDGQAVGWPSAVVGSTLLLALAGITITAIVRYEVDDALKLWAALSGIAGVVTGAFVTFFFTRGSVQQAQQQAQAREREAEERERERQEAQANQLTAVQALGKVAGALDTRQWERLQQDPTVAQALEPPTET